ncbi:MAG TPA: hypothetical protein VF883_13550 [Thermoanaerobaculia bacterium]
MVQWKERDALVLEIPMEGVPQGEAQDEKCDGTYALVYAGHGRTNAGSSWRVSLPAISCLRPAPGGDRRPSVVATPTDSGMTDDVPRPYLLVVRTNGADITIWSYAADGNLAPDVEFSWHVVVEGTLVG